MLPKMIHGSMVNNLIEKFQKNTLYMIMSPLPLIKGDCVAIGKSVIPNACEES
jgi:hypothetical protein